MKTRETRRNRTLAPWRIHQPGAWLVLLTTALGAAGLQLSARQQQPSEVAIIISSESGRPPLYAVPAFAAVNPEAAEAAKVIGPVLWDDFDFEREVALVARDTAATVPVPRTADQVPFASWREIGADAVVFGSVQRTGNTLTVQVRLFNVATRQQVFAQEYTGSTANPRQFAHNIADDIHLQQRRTRGVARTKIVFVSNRAGGKVAGTVQNRTVKEIWMSDYDGFNQRRVTYTRDLNSTPTWSPDGGTIAYSSWRSVAAGGQVDILLSQIYKGMLDNLTKGVGNSSTPEYSPDGSRIAFYSNRESNVDIYVVNRDGSGLRRLTTHQAGDNSPTWAPNGQRIAFISDRTGQPQLYTMNADGTDVQRVPVPDGYVDRPTWSPAPFNEIAYTARVPGGFDIKVYDFTTGSTRTITDGVGSNESPSYSPNGKHIVFSSSRNRAGGYQIFTIGRDGRGLRQVTREGINEMPAWSN